MDPLALLCNLHGDGPSTLNRLRRSGHETLLGLQETDRAELASLLGWEDPRLDRFLREARQLVVRLGEGLLERHEDAVPIEPPKPVVELGLGEGEATALVAELDEDLVDDTDEVEVEVEEAERELATQWYEEEGYEDGEEEEEDEDALPDDMREVVLERWAELDEEDRGVAPGSPAEERAGDVLVPASPPASLSASPPASPSASPASAVSQARSARPRVVSLADANLDGLTPERLHSLRAAGVETLEDLAEAGELDLHRASGLAFTQVSRLRFLATRALRELPDDDPRELPGRTGTAAPEVVAGFVEGSLGEARLDAGGPFA